MVRRQPVRIRGVSPEVGAAARALRSAMTPAEQRLWSALQGQRLYGLRFRIQHPLGPFILDFCCPSHRLIVELDGAVHDQPERAQHDVARTAQLTDYGYRVLRFRNDEVLGNLPGVLARIVAAAQAHSLIPSHRAIR